MITTHHKVLFICKQKLRSPNIISAVGLINDKVGFLLFPKVIYRREMEWRREEQDNE